MKMKKPKKNIKVLPIIDFKPDFIRKKSEIHYLNYKIRSDLIKVAKSLRNSPLV
jgi:hypothetical protein